MLWIIQEFRERRNRKRENERIAREHRIKRDKDLYRFMTDNPGTFEVIKSSWVREGDIIYQSEELPPVQVNGLYWDGLTAMGSFTDHHGMFHHIGIMYPERTILWQSDSGQLYRNPQQRSNDANPQRRNTSRRRYESRYVYRGRR